MDDKNKAVKASQDAATDGVKVTAPNAPTGDGIDYAAELSALLDENSRIARDRDNYRDGLLAIKNKKAQDSVASEEEVVVNDDADAIAKRVIEKVLPALQRSTAQETINSVLNELSGDANEQKLILYHFDNSVGSNGTVRERLENAKLIANKKSILKANSELTVALRNRTQMGNSGQGSSTEDVGQVGSTFFTNEQLAYFKKRNLDPEKVKANLIAHKNK